MGSRDEKFDSDLRGLKKYMGKEFKLVCRGFTHRHKQIFNMYIR